MTGVLKRAGLLMAGLALSASTLLAQTRTITGKVLEEGSRAPIAAAQLQVQGTNIGALTRDDGAFSIVGVPSRDVVLVVRRIGYPLTRITLEANRNTLEIVLKKDVLNLDQVVVTGQASG
ncbi:MAG: carboxypeptidase-like regulatory domain-containing protein, partial [Gemmatimonas sp.]